MPEAKYSALLFRALAALAVVVAFFLTLVVPQHMRESADWSFYYATQNFAAGHLTVDAGTIGLQEGEAAQYGGVLGQYVEIAPGKWALTEAPGYIFYLLPFYLIHAPELGNFALAAGMAAVAYLLLKRLKGERAACLGVALLIFSPVAMAMMQRAYPDTFAAAAFLSMGGGLYIYHRLSRQEFTPGRSRMILFLSGLGLGMAVFANYLNALAAGVFLLHMIFTMAWDSVSGPPRQWRSSLWVLPGLALPMAGLMAYQAAVFGSPWTVGLSYSLLPVGFATRYWLGNVKYVTVALLVGFPLLVPALVALSTAGYRKVYALISGEPVASSDSMPELPVDILLLLAGWIAAVYGLYSFYQWTSASQIAGMPFITMARFYLPAALPLAVLGVLWLERVPRRLAVGVTVFALVWGAIFFAQSALSYPVVPAKSPYNPMASSAPLTHDTPMLAQTDLSRAGFIEALT